VYKWLMRHGNISATVARFVLCILLHVDMQQNVCIMYVSRVTRRKAIVNIITVLDKKRIKHAQK